MSWDRWLELVNAIAIGVSAAVAELRGRRRHADAVSGPGVE